MQRWAKLHAKTSESFDFATAANKDPRAGLLFLLMLPHLDVYGVIIAHPRMLAGRVCGLIDWSEKQVLAAIQTMDASGLANLYEDSNGVPMLYAPGYHRHQDIKWSRVGRPEHDLPANWQPPEALIEAINEDGSIRAADWPAKVVQDQSRTTPGLVPQTPPLEVEVEVEVEEEVETPHAETEPACADCGLVHTPKDPQKMDSDERMLNRAFEEMTGGKLSCEYAAQKSLVDAGKKKSKPLNGLGGLNELIGSTDDALIESILAHQKCPKLPNGKKPWGWFSKAFRQSISGYWKWEDDDKPAEQPSLYEGAERNMREGR